MDRSARPAIGRHDTEIQEIRAAQKRSEEQIAAVTSLVGRLAQAEIALVERMNQPTERMNQTDDNVNTLVKIADDLIRRNGGSKA